MQIGHFSDIAYLLGRGPSTVPPFETSTPQCESPSFFATFDTFLSLRRVIFCLPVVLFVAPIIWEIAASYRENNSKPPIVTWDRFPHLRIYSAFCRLPDLANGALPSFGEFLLPCEISHISMYLERYPPRRKFRYSSSSSRASRPISTPPYFGESNSSGFSTFPNVIFLNPHRRIFGHSYV